MCQGNHNLSGHAERRDTGTICMLRQMQSRSRQSGCAAWFILSDLISIGERKFLGLDEDRRVTVGRHRSMLRRNRNRSSSLWGLYRLLGAWYDSIYHLLSIVGHVDFPAHTVHVDAFLAILLAKRFDAGAD